MTSRLDRLRALHAAATPGVMTVRDALGSDGEFDAAIVDETPKVIGEFFGLVARDANGLRPAGANARSFVATHNALPSLLACVDALRALAPDHPALAPLLEEQP
jgi:hypothetical protein